MVSQVIRLRDWRSRLAGALDRIAPFAWGTSDCLTGLVAAATVATHGKDVAARWRGRYATQAGALRVMRNDGFNDLADLLASVTEEIHTSRASEGDLAAVPSGDAFGSALGVVSAGGVVLLTSDGLTHQPMPAAHRAFRVC